MTHDDSISHDSHDTLCIPCVIPLISLISCGLGCETEHIGTPSSEPPRLHLHEEMAVTLDTAAYTVLCSIFGNLSLSGF